MAKTYWGIGAGLATGLLYAVFNAPDSVIEVPESEAYCSVNMENPFETYLVDAKTEKPLSKTLKVDNVRGDGHTVIAIDAKDADLSRKFSFYVDFTKNGFNNDGRPTCFKNHGQPEGQLYSVKYVL